LTFFDLLLYKRKIYEEIKELNLLSKHFMA